MGGGGRGLRAYYEYTFAQNAHDRFASWTNCEDPFGLACMTVCSTNKMRSLIAPDVFEWTSLQTASALQAMCAANIHDSVAM